MNSFQDIPSSRNRFVGPLMLLIGFVSFALVVALAPSALSENTAAVTAESPQSVQESFAPVEVTLPHEYQMSTSWGDIGLKLVAAGAIDIDRFVQLYENSGRPLTSDQKRIFSAASDKPIVIDFENARFLLNFFWALGLVNHNPILTEGPLMQAAEGNIGRFASTGGWSLGQRPATELYASAPIITLTSNQQARLDEVAANVYRPCCNNQTAFADCNHGMAMLGLLELLASEDASTQEMYNAAKAVNGYWFPQQALETAVFFKAAMNLDYTDVDPQMAVGPEVFSGSGYQQVNQWLAENNLLDQSQNGGNSCAV